MNEPEPAKDAAKPADPDPAIVPTWDVRNCPICSQPMQQLKCKYQCRTCGAKIDCSDPY